MPGYSTVTVPAGDAIRTTGGVLQVPDHPSLPFIEGDGTGPTSGARAVGLRRCGEKAHGGRRRIAGWRSMP
jgi:isocitrate dehydrogenase